VQLAVIKGCNGVDTVVSLLIFNTSEKIDNSEVNFLFSLFQKPSMANIVKKVE
jgi:hypothetical protein